jgi:hypothetical protein
MLVPGTELTAKGIECDWSCSFVLSYSRIRVLGHPLWNGESISSTLGQAKGPLKKMRRNWMGSITQDTYIVFGINKARQSVSIWKRVGSTSIKPPSPFPHLALLPLFEAIQYLIVMP